MDTKKQIEQLYIDALYNDEAPNVFADRILSLFGVVSTCCAETMKVNQFLKRPSKYCMTCSKELKKHYAFEKPKLYE